MADHFFDTRTAPKFSDEAMQKVNLHESPKMFCDVHCLVPGQAHASHAHVGEDKIYLVLTGRVTVEVDGEEREMGPGEGAAAPAGVSHGVRNGGQENATLLVVMAPHPKPPDEG